MNKFIQKELDKVKTEVVQTSENTFLIKKRQVNNYNPGNEFIVGNTYIVKLANYIIHEPSNFTLSKDWNKGVKPISEYLQGTVIQIKGNMIQFNAQGIDIQTKNIKPDNYSGLWLPRKAITIIE